MKPKYPDVTVSLSGEDGNVFAIIARARGAMRRADIDEPEIEAFTTEMGAGNYDDALQTVMRWFDTD